MVKGGIYSGLGAGAQGLTKGSLNPMKRKKPTIGPRVAPEVKMAEGDFTIQDKRLNKGAPTNVPSVFGGQKAPFPRNDPRFRDWIVKNALKTRQRYRSFGNLQEAMAAAQAFGRKGV